jgi:hypothetical protein
MPVFKPHELFGRQGSQVQATQATSQYSPTLATAGPPGPQQQSALTQALRISESTNITSTSPKSALSDSDPLSFAPVMAATPAGYS